MVVAGTTELLPTRVTVEAGLTDGVCEAEGAMDRRVVPLVGVVWVEVGRGWEDGRWLVPGAGLVLQGT